MIKINVQIPYKGMTFDSGMVIVLNVGIQKTDTGNQVIAAPVGVYVSDAARIADPLANPTTDHAFPRSVSFDYDRGVDGVDVLSLAHEKYKEAIVTQKGIAAEYIEIFNL